MSPRDVVITGAGMVSSLGADLQANLDGVRGLRTGLSVHAIEGVPAALRVYGEAAEVEPLEGLAPNLLPHAKFLNTGALLGLAAAREAVAASGLALDEMDPGRKSAYVGAGDLTKIDLAEFHGAMKEASDGKWREVDRPRLNAASLGGVYPFILLESLNNNLFSFLTAVFEVRGSSTSLAGLSPTGAQSLGLAFRAVREGRSDAALAVGYAAWSKPTARYELYGLDLLSAAKAGEKSYRPMDRRRDGFFPGDGGAALLLEPADLARARGANVLARLSGFADAQERAENGGFGIPLDATVRAARQALDEAGLSASDLALISPHGSGTRKGDRAEMAACLRILDGAAPNTPISCMKPYTGHMAAASDLADLALSLLCLQEGLAPATPNYERSEDEFAALSVSPEHRAAEGKAVLSISYGIGGQVAATVASVD